MKLEPELLEPRSHRIPEAPRIGFVLETMFQMSVEEAAAKLPEAESKRGHDVVT